MGAARDRLAPNRREDHSVERMKRDTLSVYAEALSR
jgi:hypothetical protein